MKFEEIGDNIRNGNSKIEVDKMMPRNKTCDNNVSISNNDIHFYKIDIDGSLYYSYKDKLMKFSIIQDDNDTDMMDKLITINDSQYDKQECYDMVVSYKVIDIPLDQYKQQVENVGGKVTIKKITLHKEDGNSFYYYGRRGDYKFEDHTNVPIIFPIQMKNSNTFICSYIDPYNRRDIRDRLIVLVNVI